jgi:uncharacterized protein
LKIIHVKVKPNAKVSRFEETKDGSWLALLKSPPVDGKANRELLGLIAGHYSCPKSSITIKSGAAGRLKLVQIDI